MTITFKDIFKRRSRTVKFNKANKDEYDKKFERVKVASTKVVAIEQTAQQIQTLKNLTENELVVRLDRARGKDREAIKQALKNLQDAKRNAGPATKKLDARKPASVRLPASKPKTAKAATASRPLTKKTATKRL